MGSPPYRHGAFPLHDHLGRREGSDRNDGPFDMDVPRANAEATIVMIDTTRRLPSAHERSKASRSPAIHRQVDAVDVGTRWTRKKSRSECDLLGLGESV